MKKLILILVFTLMSFVKVNACEPFTYEEYEEFRIDELPYDYQIRSLKGKCGVLLMNEEVINIGYITTFKLYTTEKKEESKYAILQFYNGYLKYKKFKGLKEVKI